MKSKRPKKAPPWEPLRNVTAEVTPELWQTLDGSTGQLREIWQSRVYEVFVRDVPSEGVPQGIITWLSIKRRDRSAIHDWRHLQRIKNEICGPEREACEVYPSESRMVDTSNQYHLWVLAEGHGFPFGYVERRVVGPHDSASRQRPFEEGLEPSDVISPEVAQKSAQAVVRARQEPDDEGPWVDGMPPVLDKIPLW